MALNQQRALSWPCSIVLVIYLLSIWAIPSESGNSYPTQHGLAQEKEPGEASPAMETFFRGRPEVALPMAQNITKPVLGLAVRAAPKEPAHSGSQNHTRAALLITGVVCGVVGLVLLGIVVVAYAIRAHRSKNWSGAHLSAGMTRFRSSPKARLGGATREVI